MIESEEAFLRSLRAAFKVEAAEHLQAITSGLLELERDPRSSTSAGALETIFREAHSLKGAARAVDHADIEEVCQSLENAFGRWKRQGVGPEPGAFDRVHRAVDGIRSLLSDAPAESAGARHRTVADAVRELSRLTEALPVAAAPPATEAPSPETKAAPAVPAEAGAEASAEAGLTVTGPAPTALAEPRLAATVRVATAKLDRLLAGAEELLSVKLALSRRVEELREARAGIATWAKEWSRASPRIRGPGGGNGDSPPADQGRAAALEFIDLTHTRLHALDDKLASLTRAAEDDDRATGKLVDTLLEEAKRLLVFPFSLLLNLFPKLVRDLSRDQGKEIDVVLRGEEVEIDRRILEELKVPLIHLVRNCVDHGIEPPATRTERHKPARATILIAVSRVSGNEVELLVSDDGAGIDLGQVKSAAVRQGLVSASDAAQLSDHEALLLVFQSGVSTSSIITELSGRGLGLAIVREKIEHIGGRVSVDTERGRGTNFRLRLPIALATFRGLLVRTHQQLFVLPTVHVQRVLRLRKGEVKTVENRETIAANGSVLSFVRLGELLRLPPIDAPAEQDYLCVVVLAAGETSIAFAVDEVLNDQEIVFKTLGKPLLRIRNVAGATILGSGRAVPILHVSDLIKSAIKFGPSPAKNRLLAPKPRTLGKSVLVVEDSITSRMLLKNILEANGYRVTTAVDGADALATLKTEDFDVVVSDVEMPRLNGFDLTARIRADQRLADKPVVLVTALASREDRERGIEVGANAYIVKSSFDQGSLLTAIQRLV